MLSISETNKLRSYNIKAIFLRTSRVEFPLKSVENTKLFMQLFIALNLCILYLLKYENKSLVKICESKHFLLFTVIRNKYKYMHRFWRKSVLRKMKIIVARKQQNKIISVKRCNKLLRAQWMKQIFSFHRKEK